LGSLLWSIIFTVCFSPGNSCNGPIVDAIDLAEKTVDIAIYSFTDTYIAEAVLEADRRGVKVRILMDKLQAAGKYALDEFLIEADLFVCVDKRSGAMHHKFVVIDEMLVITGSYNWTANANKKNNENLLMILDKRLAKEYTLEFERLLERHECLRDM